MAPGRGEAYLWKVLVNERPVGVSALWVRREAEGPRRWLEVEKAGQGSADCRLHRRGRKRRNWVPRARPLLGKTQVPFQAASLNRDAVGRRC